MNPKKETTKKESSGKSILNIILNRTTKAVTRFSLPVLLIAIILAGLGFYTDSKIGIETDIESFMPQDMPALTDIRIVRDNLGSTDQVVLYMNQDNIINETTIHYIRDLTVDINNKYSDIVVDVKSIDALVEGLSPTDSLVFESYRETIDNLPEQQSALFINEAENETVNLLNIMHLDIESLQSFIESLKADLAEAPLSIDVTGKSVLDIELVKGLTSGRITMTLLGLGLVFVALLIVYRNLFKALMPIIPVSMILGMSSGLMYILGIDYTPITSTLAALVLGMGTEITVMLMERYIEERNLGKRKQEAIIHSTAMIGKAIVASGLTTVGGFSVLMLSDFPILKDFGLMTVINISLALLSTFIILPPILTLFDKLLIGRKGVAGGQ